MDTKLPDIIEKKISELTKTMRIDEDQKSIFKLISTQDPNKKTLELISGTWDDKRPWFIVDEDGDVHTVSNMESLLYFMKNLKDLEQENFGLKLEKAILEQLPIDFFDVWAVAMGEIQEHAHSKRKRVEVDLSKLVKEIKKNHPNLFYKINFKEQQLIQ